jgi:hypothetical protein
MPAVKASSGTINLTNLTVTQLRPFTFQPDR